MGALRREFVDRAFEAIESMRLALGYDLKRLVVVVSACIAFRHFELLVAQFSARVSQLSHLRFRKRRVS